MVAAALIGAGASLLGGILGRSAQKTAQQREYERQKEFAQTGIQWKVRDAKAAGIHPIYALGAPTTSYAPQSIGGDPLQRGLEGMGQDISRAVGAATGPKGRAAAIQQRAAELSLDNASLRNDMLRLQIRRMAQPGTGPGVDPATGKKLVPPEQMSSPITMGGRNVPTSRRWDNAQTIEDRYGDAISWAYGFPVLARDLWDATRDFRERHERKLNERFDWSKWWRRQKRSMIGPH